MVSKKVSFKAGRMRMNVETKQVKAERGQYTVTMEHSDDGEKIFSIVCTSEPTREKEEFYCFPGMTFFDKVRKTNGGRIFYLLIDFDCKEFFWMQEPDASKDDTICKQVNDIINFDETAQPAPTPNQPSTSNNTAFPSSYNNLFNNPSMMNSYQSQLQSMMAGNQMGSVGTNLQTGGSVMPQSKMTTWM